MINFQYDKNHNYTFVIIIYKNANYKSQLGKLFNSGGRLYIKPSIKAAV